MSIEPSFKLNGIYLLDDGFESIIEVQVARISPDKKYVEITEVKHQYVKWIPAKRKILSVISENKNEFY